MSFDYQRDRDEERRVQRMTPAANESKEAIALRKAALAFAGVPDTGDFHDAAGMRANRDLLRAARAYAPVAARAETEAKKAAQPERVLRIQDATDEPVRRRGGWIERYFLRDARGRYRERNDIPGNGQYAPGPGEILAWFRRMGVTHVEVAEGWHDSVPAKVYKLATFARHMHRVTREAES